MDGMIINGEVLVDGSTGLQSSRLGWTNGRLLPLGEEPTSETETVVDASGCVVVPGIIDLHGDAFERAVMPRGGVRVPLDIAMDENDAQLLAAGITTSFLSATDSWEPGLRSRQTLRELVDAVGGRTGGPRVLLHVRHERCNTDDLGELQQWIEDGTVRVLSYNDHTPGGNPLVTELKPSQISRSGVTEAALQALLATAMDRRPQGLEQEQALADVAQRSSVSTASHDPADLVDLQRDLDLGVRFAEFPTSVELATAYRDAGVPVLLGAPNLVRGGSHLGNLAVADAIAAGACDILCSDYHYPSLLQAPFQCAEQGLASFADAWAMVSRAPADAAGLADYGRITSGAVADLAVIEPPKTGPARIRAVVVDGRLVYSRHSA